MIRVRKATDRGHLNHGWLDTYHTFSFGDYHDPAHMHFRALRVMNEDWVAPGRGFPTHGHADMEIVTYVLAGALSHQDSIGAGGSTLRPGEFQRMTAGTGITHSEFNPSATEPVHLYQVWLIPERKGLTPSYEQKAFPADGRPNQFRLVACPEATDGALAIRTDARIYLAALDAGAEATHAIPPGRHAWLQVLGGQVVVAGTPLAAGDGVALGDEPALTVRADAAAEVMLFDLA